MTTMDTYLTKIETQSKLDEIFLFEEVRAAREDEGLAPWPKNFKDQLDANGVSCTSTAPAGCWTSCRDVAFVGMFKYQQYSCHECAEYVPETGQTILNWGPIAASVNYQTHFDYPNKQTAGEPLEASDYNPTCKFIDAGKYNFENTANLPYVRGVPDIGVVDMPFSYPETQPWCASVDAAAAAGLDSEGRGIPASMLPCEEKAPCYPIPSKYAGVDKTCAQGVSCEDTFRRVVNYTSTVTGEEVTRWLKLGPRAARETFECALTDAEVCESFCGDIHNEKGYPAHMLIFGQNLVDEEVKRCLTVAGHPFSTGSDAIKTNKNSECGADVACHQLLKTPEFASDYKRTCQCIPNLENFTANDGIVVPTCEEVLEVVTTPWTDDNYMDYPCDLCPMQESIKEKACCTTKGGTCGCTSAAAEVTTKTTTFSIPFPTGGAWANIDLSKMSAEELAAGKARLISALSSAGGFSGYLVEFINLVQGGKVIDIVAAARDAGLLDGVTIAVGDDSVAVETSGNKGTLNDMMGPGGGQNRKRRASGAIVADIVFKGVKSFSSSTNMQFNEKAPDYAGMMSKLNAAIAAGDVAVTLTVGGEDIPAQFSAEASKTETEETSGGDGSKYTGIMAKFEDLVAKIGLSITLGFVILGAAVFVLCCLPIICCCCGCCCCGSKSGGKEHSGGSTNVVQNGGFGF